jgi:hypothetical protein
VAGQAGHRPAAGGFTTVSSSKEQMQASLEGLLLMGAEKGSAGRNGILLELSEATAH